MSGHVGWLARERWGVPLVHTAHTLAKVKNAALAAGDTPEPRARVIGEEQVVDAADRLVASTDEEAADLVDHYGADPDRVVTIAPGVDLEVFRPGEASTARTRLGIPPDAAVLAFAGRLQPLKAPDLLIRAAADLLDRRPSLRDRLVVLVVGGPSGHGLDPADLRRLAAGLGVADIVRIEPAAPQRRLAEIYRAADIVVVPSHNESFGLVAVESQACGTPVVAAAVGGLRTAVNNGVSGVLVDRHDPVEYARVLRRLLAEPRYRAMLGRGAVRHAARFSWQRTVDGLLDGYRAALSTRHTDLTPV
jgi:D-inositol-3-phosphate glycosyltransferase